MTRCRTALIVCALLACTKPDGAPARHSPGTPAGGVARDSTWIEVRGPTLVAFWPAHAQAVLDSGGDGATALDDFGYHLASADSTLRALGFHVASVEGRRFHIVANGQTTTFVVPRDSAELGYYLIAPGRAPAISYGVQTDADLAETARQYLSAGGRRP